MQLTDLKPSILELPQEEALLIHREIRRSRTESKPAVSKAKRATVKRTTKAQAEIKQDPEKIKELLRLLGEDV
jgi:predicted translin family RNA/ssDNA-binding protein